MEGSHEITTVRRTTIEDAPGIARVHVAAWRWAYAGLMPADYLDGLDADARMRSWTRVIGDESTWSPDVAVDDHGEVVGFSHAGPSRDEDAVVGQTGEVTAIYITSDRVGTGTGWQLWSAALDRLRTAGMDDVTVWVLDSNARGRAFYERVGLRADGAGFVDDDRGFPLTHMRYRGSVPST